MRAANETKRQGVKEMDEVEKQCREIGCRVSRQGGAIGFYYVSALNPLTVTAMPPLH